MTKPICSACHQPIKDGQAHITENTPTSRRKWHHWCCPWLPENAAGTLPAHRQDPEKRP
jgi:hypothetical protein